MHASKTHPEASPANSQLSPNPADLAQTLLSGMAGGEIFQSFLAGASREASRWAKIQACYAQRQSELWLSLLQGRPPQELAGGSQDDRRFRAPEWREHPLFAYLKQSYLLACEGLMEAAKAALLDPKAKQKLLFFTRQLIDATCPANFPATNPEALKLAVETGGESFARGLRNLAADLKKGRISMTDEGAFEVGHNLALTPGAVVYENELIQLIQYAPITDKVYARPLLIVPPFINKYYILDLQPENSFVRYCVEQGHTVFIISWRNIPPELGTLTWEDYLELGVFQALEAALAICGVGKANVLGFCVGGTLLACALAVLRAKGEKCAASLTLLTSLLDFADPGEIGVYVDEAYVAQREADFKDGGVMPGRELAAAFASLRANELIWHYVVNNYLKGRDPEPFDLLYWNSDSANLPGRLYAYYVRHMYLENNLRIPGKLVLCGVPVDLSRVDLPTYALAAREDHIVPWQSAYASARLLGGTIQFVLTASGHIAGVVNPASKNRRQFWTSSRSPTPPLGGRLPDDPEEWLAEAKTLPGSWWRHFIAWLNRRGGAKVPARTLGSPEYPALEPAPGRYVKVRYD